MSQALTLGKVKTICARALSLRPADTVLLDYINRAQERLLYEGKWVGSYGRYRVCVSDSLLTWPREIETIEAWALCDWPGTVRTGWYEFIDSGPGLLDEDSCNGRELVDRGNACSFDDPDGGTTKVLSIYAEETETTTTPLICQFYDFNGRWVRTQSSGSWIDGEGIAIPSIRGTYVDGTRSLAKGGLVRVIKPVTNGRIHLFEKDTSAGTYKALAQYQPREEIPIYRRSLIPGLQNITCGTSDTVSVSVVGKLRHIPVVSDNDFLLISHQEAMRNEVMAIFKEENNNLDAARQYHAQAIYLLNKQLDHWHGSGVVHPVRMAPSNVWGGGIESVM